MNLELFVQKYWRLLFFKTPLSFFHLSISTAFYQIRPYHPWIDHNWLDFFCFIISTSLFYCNVSNIAISGNDGFFWTVYLDENTLLKYLGLPTSVIFASLDLSFLLRLIVGKRTHKTRSFNLNKIIGQPKGINKNTLTNQYLRYEESQKARGWFI